MPKRNPAIKKYTSRGQTKYKFQVYLGQYDSAVDRVLALRLIGI